MAQEINTSVDKPSGDWRWLVLAAGLIFLFTSLPYFIGLAQTDPGWQFSGFVFGVEDGNSYLAKMRQGMLGDWLYRTPYTAYPQSGTLTNLSYLLLGKLASGGEVRLQFIAIFHAFRLAGILFCLWAGFRLAMAVGLMGRQAIAVSVLTLVGGGLGWLAFLGVSFGGYGGLPLEFYSPESFGFLMALGLPHLLFARGGLFLAAAALLKGAHKKPFQAGARAGAWLVFAWIFQPQTPLLGYFIAAIWVAACLFNGIVWRDKIKGELLALAGYFLPSLPLVILSFAQFLLDPAGRGWYSQNLISAPPFGDYLLAYGLPMLLVGVGLAVRRKPINRFEWFLMLWIAALPVLVYSPYVMQRRLADGIWFALCALVFLVWGRQPGRKAVLAIFASGAATSLLIWGGAIVAVRSPAAPVFVRLERVELYAVLARISDERAVVLANKPVSNEIPAWTNMRVVIGHGPETLEYSSIEPFVNTWLSAPQQGNLELLKILQVDYFIKTPQDPLASGYPETWDLVYDRAGYQIYRVK